MVTALIVAAGTGQRMNARARPKQFLNLHGKPIILYTLEHFEAHPEVDNIVVVCLKSWISELNHLLRRYDFEKVTQVVPGGEGGYESIYNGLKAMEGASDPDDIVLIHDGVRPLINAELISANIAKAGECGAVITVEAVTESVVRLGDGNVVAAVPPRDEMYTAKAPQSFRYGLILNLYQRAHKGGIPTIDSAHLCSIFGLEMHTVKSTSNNIKITTPQDYYIFRALYEAMENQQILGI
jgi:2-C-methyl-D-erythritol 4-phosphate cytidylyltransferase